MQLSKQNNRVDNRNLLSTQMKESKRSYFTNYFQNNLNDMKNT